MKLETQTLIVLAGWPGVGKSTVAKILAERFNIRHIDIDDDVRTTYFGVPPANDGTDPEIDKRDRAEMGGSYTIFFGLIEGFLQAGRSLIVTSTLSSKKHGQDRLMAICAKYPHARLRLLWLKPDLDDEEIKRRLDQRMAAGYTGGTRSVMRIRELEKRYEPIVIPHHVLDNKVMTLHNEIATPLIFSIGAENYILSPQPHDN